MFTPEGEGEGGMVLPWRVRVRVGMVSLWRARGCCEGLSCGEGEWGTVRLVPVRREERG